MNLSMNAQSPRTIIVALLVFFLVWATAVASIALVVTKNTKDLSFARAKLLTILEQPQNDAPLHVPEALLEVALDPASLYQLDNSVILERFSLLKERYPSHEQLADIIIPADTWILARLFTNSDDLVINYDISQNNAFGNFYREVIGLIATAQSQAHGIEILLDHFYNTFYGSIKPKTLRYALPIPKGKYSLPSRRSIAYSHPDAIDIFFTQVKNRGKHEIGPDIFSVSPGIVLVARNNWEGGDTPQSYSSGGISPRAGNGVIIYNPHEKRYYSYFHLHDVTVKKGQFIKAGQKIGRGGNTGINAKKEGHGEHLHFEIYDSIKGQWSINELYEFIKSLQ